MASRFVPAATDEEIKREKARARAWRQSAWWKRRIAAGVCHYCRREVGAKALGMDHVVPLIRGGRSVRANIVPACKDCNAKKQSLLAWEWEAYVQNLGSADRD
ncbi:MAG TPA: HNH endonuclease [Methylomirabilota bacterium]|jgi:5-methylcytosine-specific restriction endonuclease McrA|nr:HNH endonuclease [Methylomirabilota bacterium]